MARGDGVEAFHRSLGVHQRLGVVWRALNVVDAWLPWLPPGRLVAGSGRSGRCGGAFGPAVLGGVAGPAYSGSGAGLWVIRGAVASGAITIFLHPCDALGRPVRAVGLAAVALPRPRVCPLVTVGLRWGAAGGGVGPHRVGWGQVVIIEGVDVSVTEGSLSAEAGQGVQVVGTDGGSGVFQQGAVHVHLQLGGVPATVDEAVGHHGPVLAVPLADFAKALGS